MNTSSNGCLLRWHPSAHGLGPRRRRHPQTPQLKTTPADTFAVAKQCPPNRGLYDIVNVTSHRSPSLYNHHAILKTRHTKKMATVRRHHHIRPSDARPATGNGT